MAASRTVDPEGKSRSARMVSLRLTLEQMDTIAELCKQRGVGRSKLIRELLREEWIRVQTKG
jgi:hypothetical protein